MTTKTHLVTDTFEAPAHWASAFINGDLTGLEPDDLADFEAWVQANQQNNVVDCSSEPHIGRWNGLQTELLTYTTLGPASDYEPCGECGFDHSYEQQEAHNWHSKNPENSQ